MIRVRIAPSPTGLLHIGTARTALFNYLFAGHMRRAGEDAQMILRIEDTDKERSTKEYEENIVSGLVKLGIAGDEGVHAGGNFGPYRQSECTASYRKHLEELLAGNHAYYCFCSKEQLEAERQQAMAAKLPPRYSGKCAALDPAESAARVAKGEPAVIRLRVPQDQDLRFNDLIRGETVIHSRELDDFVIARKIEDPLYNYTVVIDDHSMQISHVIRGEDHIPNTPKQILIYRAFGWEPPLFAHLPLILNQDKSKLSKRKNKVSVDDFLAEGYLPEALINFLALLGWHPGETEGADNTQEIFSMDELIAKFTLEKVHKGGAVFDQKKLDWINGEYIKKAIAGDVDAFYERLKTYWQSLRTQTFVHDEALLKAILRDPDFSGRFTKLSEITPELMPLFGEVPAYEATLLLNEKQKITPEILKQVFPAAIQALEGLDWQKGDPAKSAVISEKLMALPAALNLKNGQVLWPIRAALSGAEKSPNFATLAVYLGKEETLKRLKLALNKV